jgi:hypothetical protein
MKFMQAAHWTRFSAWLFSDTKERVDLRRETIIGRDALTRLFGLPGHQ